MTTRFLGTSDDVTTCDCCGRTGLKSTVALSIDDSDDVLYYGVVCAARALKTTAKVVRSETKAVDDAKAAAERAARDAAMRAESERWFAWLNAQGTGQTEVFRQIEALGGYALASAAFKTAA